VSDDAFFLLAAGLLLLGVFMFGNGNGGQDGGDGGDETAATDGGVNISSGEIVSEDDGAFPALDTGGDAQPSGGVMDQNTVFDLAQTTLANLGVTDITPQMATTIASIESSFDPAAVRQEPRINDASYGLMQVLTKTAAWLNGLGYDAFDGTAEALATPEGSMYFGCAYLHWLRNYKGAVQPDGFVVAAYNGGPGNPNGAGPQRYLASYQGALSTLGYA
jgi:hypothetical protein